MAVKQKAFCGGDKFVKTLTKQEYEKIKASQNAKAEKDVKKTEKKKK